MTNLGHTVSRSTSRTSPSSLIAAQAHLGRGLAACGHGPRLGREGRLTPLKRFATMFSGTGINNADGTEWYFPQRLTDDLFAVGSGLRNDAQRVLGVKSTLGRRLPKRLRIYAFGAALGGQAVLDGVKTLARQSHIPMRNLTLINRQRTYAHNDPAGAYPHNAFFSHLVRFLARLS